MMPASSDPSVANPSTPPTATAPGAPPPGWAPPPAAPPRKMGMIIAVVVVVLVVVAFLGLYFAGAIPGLKPSSGSSSTGVTFSAARASADSAASSYSSSYPNLEAVLGFGLSSSLSGNASEVVGASSSCHPQLLSGASGTVTVPAGNGGAGSGSLPFWEFVFGGTSGVLVVTVINGAASAFATVATGGGCSAGFGSGSGSALPANVIDSSTAAADAGNASVGGATFLKNNPNANAVFLLIGGVSFGGFGGASWAVLYSACSFSVGSTTASAPQFEAILNATTGSVTLSNSATSACSSLIPNPSAGGTGGGTTLGSAIAMGSPVEANAGGSYWYNITVQSAGSGLTWNEMDLELLAPGNSPVVPHSGWVGSVLSLGGSTPVASWDFYTFQWTSGGSTTVSSSQTLSIVTTTSLSGDTLQLLGVGQYSGTVPVALP